MFTQRIFCKFTSYDKNYCNIGKIKQKSGTREDFNSRWLFLWDTLGGRAAHWLIK